MIPGADSFSLKEGDNVGVRIAFDNGRESIYCDAQFRHGDTAVENLSLGFQFVGLAHTSEGRKILRTINNQMTHMMRLTKRVG